MKKAIIICCAIILSSFSSIENKKQVTNILTSGKWFIESVQESGQEPEMSANKNDEWVVFYKEGKLEKNTFGEIVNGTWEYSEKDNSLKLIENETSFKRIIEISDTRLTLELTTDITAGETLMINYTK